MKKMRDITNEPESSELYGGHDGYKLAKRIDGKSWMIKLPGLYKIGGIDPNAPKYGTHPVSEYIGSHIYEMAGVPVQGTSLAEAYGMLVVACEDFRNRGDEMIEYYKVQNTFVPSWTEEEPGVFMLRGESLYGTLRTLEEHRIMQMVPEIRNRFWDMWVVDALLGNRERTYWDWGILRNLQDEFRIAPVYDNGSCLHALWNPWKMEAALADSQWLLDEAYRRGSCIFYRGGEWVNPYELIRSHAYAGCDQAIKRLVPKMDMRKIGKMLDELLEAECIVKTEHCFYESLMRIRLEEVLLPALEEIQNAAG